MSDIVGVVYGVVCWCWTCPLDRVWKQLLAANIDMFSSLDLGDFEPFWTIVFLGGSLRLKTPKGPCNLTGAFHSRYGMCEGWGWPCWVARLTDLGWRCWDRSIHTIWVGAVAADPTRIAIWLSVKMLFMFISWYSTAFRWQMLELARCYQPKYWSLRLPLWNVFFSRGFLGIWTPCSRTCLCGPCWGKPQLCQHFLVMVKWCTTSCGW